jgi:predicted XRE-type DNA-binding protein
MGRPRLSKEIEERDRHAKGGNRSDPTAVAARERTGTSGEPIDPVRGSANLFRDFGHPDADREQLRAALAAEIIGVMDDRRLSIRDAQALTGVAAADFSRIRRANLGRFTIDRLMTILDRLGQEVEVTVAVRPRREPEGAAAEVAGG